MFYLGRKYSVRFYPQLTVTGLTLAASLQKMTRQQYKGLSATFLISTIWSVYVFFDYYTDSSFMPGLTLMVDFFSAVIFCIGLAALNLILRFMRFRKSNVVFFKDNFFYIFAGFSNLILCIIYFVYVIVSHNLKEFITCQNNDTFFILGSFIIGSFIVYDLCLLSRKYQ